MIDSIAPKSTYRDKWANNLLDDKNNENKEDASEEVNGAESSEQVWDAVFTDKKENGVSVNDFLNLMVSQLRNQDFMNPVDDTQYVTQMAQFATMQQMQEMALYSKTNYVMSLVGKNVTAAKFSVSGKLVKETGTVEKISLVNNEFMVYVNGKRFKLEEIMELNSTGGTTGTENQGDMQYLLSLVGKNVTVQQRNDKGEATGKLTGVVEKISTEDGKYQVYVNGAWYPLKDVLEVGGDAVEIPNGEMKPLQPAVPVPPAAPAPPTQPENGQVKPPEGGEVKPPEGEGTIPPENGEVKPPEGEGTVPPESGEATAPESGETTPSEGGSETPESPAETNPEPVPQA